MSRAGLVGAWRLVSSEFRRGDGKRLHPVGRRAAGQLMYDAHGRMNGQVMGLDRPPFAGENRLRGSDDEVRAALEGYIAYYGRYTVDEAAGTVTHRVDGSLFPNWVGTELTRHYELSGERLTLRTDPIPSGKHHYVGTLVWERLKDGGRPF